MLFLVADTVLLLSAARRDVGRNGQWPRTWPAARSNFGHALATLGLWAGSPSGGIRLPYRNRAFPRYSATCRRAGRLDDAVQHGRRRADRVLSFYRPATDGRA